MSELTVEIRAEALLARLAGAGDRLQRNLRSKVQRLAIEVQSLVKQKLSGPVLHVRTGTLRRSINQLVTEDSTGIRARVGTNVAYAAVHEYGFSGSVTVKAHTRTLASGTVQNVRSFTRTMNLPPRSFLRSTLEEEAPRIRSELRAAALDAVQLHGASNAA